MKKIFLTSIIFLAFLALLTYGAYMIFGKDNVNVKRVTTTLQGGAACTNEAVLESIPIRSCGGEGELILYKSETPFGPLGGSFVANHDQLIIFADEDAQFSLTVDGKEVQLEQLAFTDGKVRVLEGVERGSTVCLSGEEGQNAKMIQGIISQDSTRAVYDINTFTFSQKGKFLGRMFLTPGEYSYVFFNKYSMQSLSEGLDTRSLLVSISGQDGDVVQEIYNQPAPEGVQGAIVGEYSIERQGNYDLKLETEDDIYWVMLDCPVCGNGEKEKGEDCDEGERNGSSCIEGGQGDCSYCSNSCEFVSAGDLFCGDGIVSGVEECDAAAENGLQCAALYGKNCSFCTTECRKETVFGGYCGDGKIGGQEECDDGNGLDGDGCDAMCLATTGSQSTALVSNEQTSLIGVEASCLSSIGNYVWNDFDQDGIQDKEEKGLPGVSVKLVWAGADDKFGNADDQTLRDNTDTNGRYEFDGLCKGTYRVAIKNTDVASHIQTFDPDEIMDGETKVELESDSEKYSKADFGYKSKKNAPESGPGLTMLMLISLVLTVMVLGGYFFGKRLGVIRI